MIVNLWILIRSGSQLVGRSVEKKGGGLHLGRRVIKSPRLNTALLVAL